ncbi:MAG TPA: GatB/YqeY domain-containing protein [Candidatus Methanoperedens sp.]|nr:GatB/YqeY domain-containing protein [Candidatus Methanoperedens sp.]
MSLREQLEGGLKEAMKSGDRVAVAAIRLSLSEIKNAVIDKRRPLEDNEVVNILRSGVKKRQESIEMFTKGGRQDLVDKETAELKVIERFLPAGLPAAELEALVDAAIAETGAASMKDIGKVMKAVLPKVAGRADGAEINKLVRSKLPA